MAAAYIERRPKSTDEEAAVSHYVIVTGGEEKHGSFKTQNEAKDKACTERYRPVHVARVRHLQDRDTPDHWRKGPASGRRVIGVRVAPLRIGARLGEGVEAFGFSHADMLSSGGKFTGAAGKALEPAHIAD